MRFTSGDAVRTWELSSDSGIDSIFLTPLYFVGAEDDPSSKPHTLAYKQIAVW